VADVADTVAVVVQPGSGDVLQFLKSGIMEIPDVLVVAKADLGQVASRALADLHAALRAVGATATPVLAVSSVPPPTGIDELVDALDAHHAALDLPTRRTRSRRRHALDDFAAEHGDRGLRAVGGRRVAERWLAEQDPATDPAALRHGLEQRGRP
jgi:LAO/AO transport system kinase